jgi:prepilin-type N-terminal cleavage/methylation domain-containing protein
MKPTKAFTIVELMIAMAVIAVMVTLGVAAASSGRQVARDADRRNIASQIQDKVKDYFRKNASYPTEAGGTFVWQADTVQVGGNTISLLGHLKYTAANLTNAGITHYTYKRSIGGFSVCVLLESGSWYAVGTLTCP